MKRSRERACERQKHKRQRRSEDPFPVTPTIFHVQLPLLRHADAGVRVRALYCVHAHLDVLHETGHGVLFEALQERLQEEENPHVAQQIVKVMVSLAIQSSNPREKHRVGDSIPKSTRAVDALPDSSSILEFIAGTDTECCRVCEHHASQGSGGPSRPKKVDESASIVSKALLKYLFAEGSLVNCCNSSALKIQVLLCLRKLTEETGTVEMIDLTSQLIGLLASDDPFVRAEVLLLAATVFTTQPDSTEVQSYCAGDYIVDLLQEFMVDFSPIVRKAVLRAILLVGNNGFVLTRTCYARACALLEDFNAAIRLLALQVVHVWVKQKTQDQLNDEFVQICRMMIDMDLLVRMEAWNTLCSMKNIKEDLLLQALSKKPLGELSAKKGNQLPSLISISKSDVDISKMDESLSVLDNFNMGAFVHGIEDEFWEVRVLVVMCLARMSESSEKVRENIVDMLIDMLNDDSKHVRSCSLHGLFHVAHKWGLGVKDDHLQMVHAMLADATEQIRCLGRKLLGEIKLTTTDQFKSTIQSLLNSIKKHSNEGNQILYTVYKLGRVHTSYIDLLEKHLLKELNGYISSDPSELNVAFSECILSLLIAGKRCDINAISDLPRELSMPKMKLLRLRTLAKLPSFHPVVPQDNQVLLRHVKDFIETTMKQAYDVKNFLDHKMFNIAFQGLRACENDLRLLRGKLGNNHESMMAFSLCLIDCLEFIAQARMALHQGTHLSTILNFKLELVVKRMQHAFVGHTMEQQYQLLELNLIQLVWRIMSGGPTEDSIICQRQLISTVDFMEKFDRSHGSSSFSTDVKNKLLKEKSTSDLFERSNLAVEILYSCWPSYAVVNDNISELTAELIVPGHDFEHPHMFTPGLPLGITVSIKLNLNAYKRDCRIWVQLQKDTAMHNRLYRFVEIGSQSPWTTTLEVHDLVPIGVKRCFLKAALILECCDLACKEASIFPSGFLLPLTSDKNIHLISAESI